MAGSIRQVGIEFIGKATGLKKTTKEAQGELDEFADAADKAGEKAGAGLGQKLTGKLQSASGALSKVGAVTGAGAGLAFGASMVGAMDKQQVQAKLAGQLNLTKKQSAEIGKVAGNLFTSNYGASLEDVNGAVGAVRTSIKGMSTASSKDLETTTKYALNFASAMGTDVGDAAVSAGTLVNTGLAKNSKQAFDILTATAQAAGPQMTQPILDATNEYSKHFAGLGFDGKQAMGILSTAASGGEIAIDKAGDAIKEFQIRATDLGDKGAQSALKDLGLNGEATANALLKGGKSAQTATQQIAKGLLSVKDPAKQAALTTALFGTQAEDIGKDNMPKFLAGLSGADTALGKVDGRAAQLDKTLNNTASGNLETFKRQAQQAFVTVLGDKAVPALTKLTGGLTGNQTAMQAVVGVVIALGVGITALSAAVKVVTIVTEAWSIAQKLLNVSFLTNPVFLVIAGIVALGAALVIAYKKSETFRNIVNGAFGVLKNVVGGTVTFITGVIVPFFTKKLPGAIGAGISWVKKNWPTILGILTGPIGWAVLAITKNWDKITGAFTKAKNWVTGTWSKGWSAVSGFIGGAVDKGRGLVAGNWDNIKTGFSKATTWVGSTWTKGWSGVKGWIGNAVGKGKDSVAAHLGADSGVRSKFNSLKTWTGNTWSKSWAKAKNWLKDPVGEAKTAISTFLGSDGVRAVFSKLDSWGKDIFGKRWAGIKDTFTKPIKQVVEYFGKVFGPGGGGIRKVLGDSVSALGSIFGKIGTPFKTAIKSLINLVNLKLIKGGINWLLTKLGVDKKSQVPWIPVPKFAKGGVAFPGQYTPGRDIGLAAVSGGEPIMRPEFGRAVGHNWVDKANLIARTQGVGGVRRFMGAYAGGGIVKPTKSGAQNQSYAGHSGIDFFGRVGDPILAATSGTITYVGSGRGYGNAIFETSDKGVQMVYGHSSAYHVKDGQKVTAGQNIGSVGYSGNVRPPGPGGAHLHFEVAPGGAFAQAGNRSATQKWLGGSGLMQGVISAVSGALDFLNGLSPVKWLTDKVSKLTSPGILGNALAGSVPGMIISKADDWLASKIGAASDDPGAATWQGAAVGSWTPSQLNNAATIVHVAKALGFGQRGAQIGLMTAMQESTLNNLTGGDRDSVGLFQQRAPWGSFADRHNPSKAAAMFYQGGQGGQPGLRSKAWQTMGLGQAAQAVQVSAYPSAYDKWAGQAAGLVAKSYDTGGRLPTGYTLVHNGTGRSERVLNPQQEANLSRPIEVTINVNGAMDRMATAREIKRLLTDLDRLTGGVRITAGAR